MSGDDGLFGRLERMIESLVNTMERDHNELVELARTNAAEHAEYRADIRRLYEAFSDHHREGHG